MKRETNPPMSPRKRQAYKLLVWLLSLGTQTETDLTPLRTAFRCAPH